MQDENKTEENASAAENNALGLLLNFLHKTLAIGQLAEGDAINSAGAAVLTLLPTRPEAVKKLAHKKLNVFPFKDVPLCWRRAFEEACLWLLFRNLEQVIEDANSASSTIFNKEPCGTTSKTIKGSFTFQTWVDESVRLCDQAIIFTGAPQRRAVIDTVLEWIEIEALQLSSDASETRLPKPQILDFNTAQILDEETDHRSKRRRLNETQQDEQTIPNTFPVPVEMVTPVLCKQHEVMHQHSPSLSNFENHMHNIRMPMILTDTLNHWPATKRWKTPRYWLRQTLNGRRLVPVELGTSYTDEGWGQRIMSFDEFLQDHLLLRSASESNGETDKDKTQQHRTGYLAQHDLLSQIPALRNDISVPDYCYVDTPESKNSIAPSKSPNEGPASTQQLNIWLGPTNTVSPAHTDPHHNILAQVFGRKYIRLFAPSQTDTMYPMTRSTRDENESEDNETESEATANDHGVDMGNTSRVNVGAFVPTADDAKSSSSAREAELRKFPKHESAEYLEAILEAGECLYIPKGWWHYIRSLEPSCNVSFWWD